MGEGFFPIRAPELDPIGITVCGECRGSTDTSVQRSLQTLKGLHNELYDEMT